MIQDVPFLAEGETLFVSCVLERMIVIVCVQHEYILVEGEAIEAMHILKSGKVDVIDKCGQVIRTYTHGSFFGESCFAAKTYFAQYSYRAKVREKNIAASDKATITSNKRSERANKRGE